MQIAAVSTHSGTLRLSGAHRFRTHSFPRVRSALLWLAVLCLLPAALAAQQFVTDDAAIVEARACPGEAWHGERESWVELFGEDRVRPGYQLRLRAALIPDRLSLDLSRGGHSASTEAGSGWIIGAAWTSSSFF